MRAFHKEGTTRFSALDRAFADAAPAPYFCSPLTSAPDEPTFAGQTFVPAGAQTYELRRQKLEAKVLAETALLEAVRFGDSSMAGARDCLTISEEKVASADAFFELMMKINSKFLKR